jgi:hypothetical protein
VIGPQRSSKLFESLVGSAISQAVSGPVTANVVGTSIPKPYSHGGDRDEHRYIYTTKTFEKIGVMLTPTIIRNAWFGRSRDGLCSDRLRVLRNHTVNTKPQIEKIRATQYKGPVHPQMSAIINSFALLPFIKVFIFI